MHGHLIKIVPKAGRRQDVIDFLRWDAEVARADEPGTLRFDVWDVPDEPEAIYLYETYADEAAFETHKAAAPFQRFVEVILPEQIDELTFLFQWAEAVATNA